MNADPVISILITTYNMQNYIARALDSVLVQNIDVPVEIVIADDFSMDNTIDIIESYKQKHPDKIIILYANENKGLITNFVKGLKNCRGKYIATLDADDYWIDSHKLQKQYDRLETNTDIGFIYTNFYFENEETRNRIAGLGHNHQPDNNDLYTDMLMNLWPQISTPLIRKNLLNFEELDEFAELNFHCQDLPLFASLSCKTNAAYIPEITTVYTVRKGSMSRNTDIKKRIEIFHKTKQIEDFFTKKYPIATEIEKKRNFLFSRKCLLASWFSNDFDYVNSFTENLSAKDFLKFDPKALYIFIASKNRILYNILKPWVTRKRKPGS